MRLYGKRCIPADPSKRPYKVGMPLAQITEDSILEGKIHKIDNGYFYINWIFKKILRPHKLSKEYKIGDIIEDSRPIDLKVNWLYEIVTKKPILILDSEENNNG